MAPQKGGQATKQQKQQQQQQQLQYQQSAGAGNVKKPVANNATATATATATRPAVVPAIPLPMMHRQASSNVRGNGNANANANANTNTSANSKPVVAVSSNGYPVASLEAALIDHQATGHDHAMARNKKRRSKHKHEVKTANGTHVEKPEDSETATANRDNENDNDNETDRNRNTNRNSNSNVKQHHDKQHPLKNGIDKKLSAGGVAAIANGVTNITFGDNVRDPNAPSPLVSAQVSTTPSLAGDVESIAGSSAVTGPHNGVAPNATSVPVLQPEPAVHTNNLTTLDTGRPHAHADEAIVHPVPSLAAQHPPAPHHVRHDANGVVFGGAPTPTSDSHTPSPSAGAFMPPPPRHAVNGIVNNSRKLGHTNGHRIHHGHADSHGTNFGGPATPFRPAHEHVTSMDSYGNVPAAVSIHRAALDGYPPNAAQYEPPTPHSFHGSQTSGDFNGFDNMASFHPNGLGGFDHDHRNGRSHGAPHMQSFLPPPPARRSSFEDEVMDSVIYFQNQFNSAELADCTLELKYPDGYCHPVKIHAHKLILARSPALKHSIMIARAADPGSHVITLNANDHYLRSDAWFTAVQRLYLHPLFSPPPSGNGADFAGSNMDQFRFCLGYAAAGHLLEMGDVLLRGLQVAASMVNWHTIEEALGFAFDGAAQRHYIGDDGHDYFDIDFTYGRDTRILMASITSFIVNCFPPNFELDTTVVSPPLFARIPPSASDHFPSTKSAPAIARGTSTRKASKGNRLSVIKFGDLPTAFPEEETSAAPREPAKCSPQLSRILLNLPFEDLRYILATESATPQGWNTAQDRFHALTTVVAEREARRLRAVEAVRAHAVSGAREIQHRLSAPRRYDIVDAWDVLNWQEEVVQPNGAGVPSLIRKWVPQFGVPAELVQTSPPYDQNYQESMV
ncbi:hypothetical protein BKA67DRAFT_542011 [Truncatella angustata]|uniref:BTB domain-containing protein n=1 Tax=Truncatella angustata TaxID=152316 RepID=A0A9P8RKK0_9PEZI|nr:uncharacterized protein BKA67DRAFT_542011 [Truncatella angustata]KAH6645025.1 hypothetical protein BKA67DRAFT_542011 [Truncatella angustata]KAH8201073.1 hypothetical protein TruAng_004769 [Truncatella angustata]